MKENQVSTDCLCIRPDSTYQNRVSNETIQYSRFTSTLLNIFKEKIMHQNILQHCHQKSYSKHKEAKKRALLVQSLALFIPFTFCFLFTNSPNFSSIVPPFIQSEKPMKFTRKSIAEAILSIPTTQFGLNGFIYRVGSILNEPILHQSHSNTADKASLHVNSFIPNVQSYNNEQPNTSTK